jgi:hypothetical protein
MGSKADRFWQQVGDVRLNFQGGGGVSAGKQAFLAVTDPVNISVQPLGLASFSLSSIFIGNPLYNAWDVVSPPTKKLKRFTLFFTS